MISKRRDDKGRVLQQGEWQEPSGRYRYKYTDSLGKRKILYMKCYNKVVTEVANKI